MSLKFSQRGVILFFLTPAQWSMSIGIYYSLLYLPYPLNLVGAALGLSAMLLAKRLERGQFAALVQLLPFARTSKLPQIVVRKFDA